MVSLFSNQEMSNPASKLSLSTFSTFHAESYGDISKYQSLSKLSNSDVMILNYSCDCIHHLLCAKAQWASNMGKQCSSFSAFGEGLMPTEDCQISRPLPTHVRFTHQLQSPLQISLTDNKISSHFSVHFSHPFLKVLICEG